LPIRAWTLNHSNLTVWCSETTFPVEIAGKKTVGALRKAIKVEKQPAFDYIPTDTLALWKVLIPVDDNLEDTLRNLVDENHYRL
jgi:hypothetical protein